jgi:hypothetical protein
MFVYSVYLFEVMPTELSQSQRQAQDFFMARKRLQKLANRKSICFQHITR